MTTVNDLVEYLAKSFYTKWAHASI
jgi:hypothetical protein